MNKADLEAIKARLAAASEGPWNSNAIRMATGEPYPAVYGPSPLQGFPDEIRIADCDTHCLSEDICLANAKFIAHSPADIAALIAEVERLRSIIEIAVKLYEGDETTKYETYNAMYEALLNAGLVKRGRI